MSNQTKFRTVEELLARSMVKREELESLNTDIAAMQRTLELVDLEVAVPSEVSAKTMDTSFLADCKTQREALIRIAETSTGYVRISAAAKVIIAAKLSRGTYASVQATCHNICSGDEDHWEYISHGLYRLRDWKDPETGSDVGNLSPSKTALEA